MATNSHVLHGIVKQHQVHGRVEFIVAVHRFLEHRLQRFPVLHRPVMRVRPATCEVAVDKRLLQQRGIRSGLSEEGETGAGAPPGSATPAAGA